MPYRNIVMCRSAVAGVVGALIMLAAPAASAQPRWGRPRTPQAGACFYRDADYRGDFFCVSAGDDVSVLPDGMNDQISSIKTFGRVEVTIFQNGRFRGRSDRFDSDVRNLRDRGWNDELSSMRVSRPFGGGGGFGGGDNRPGGGDNRQGGGDNRQSGGARPGDAERIVRRAYQDLLNREPDAAGLRLYRGRIIDDGWSEAQVRDALRESPEYRTANTMTRPKAEEIVRRAYRSVLNREPDPGSQPFVDKVLRDHWTEDDVARELRKSPEYRNKRQ
jgi:hypothetical protein